VNGAVINTGFVAKNLDIAFKPMNFVIHSRHFLGIGVKLRRLTIDDGFELANIVFCRHVF
jgi:hypothetical protein